MHIILNKVHYATDLIRRFPVFSDSFSSVDNDITLYIIKSVISVISVNFMRRKYFDLKVLKAKFIN